MYLPSRPIPSVVQFPSWTMVGEVVEQVPVASHEPQEVALVRVRLGEQWSLRHDLSILGESDDVEARQDVHDRAHRPQVQAALLAERFQIERIVRRERVEHAQFEAGGDGGGTDRRIEDTRRLVNHGGGAREAARERASGEGGVADSAPKDDAEERGPKL